MIKSLALFFIMAGLVLAGLSLEMAAGSGSALTYEDAVKTVLNASPAAESSNQLPALIGFQPDQKGPAKAGSTISWSAMASDPDGDSVLYQFWLNGPSTGNTWKSTTNWTAERFWNWTTSSKDIGNNIVEVRVRDGHHANPEGWDGKLSAEFLVEANANQKPSVLSLKPDKVSPQPQGTQITWTAKAYDPDGDTILYQFWLKGPSTDETWSPVTDWTTKNIWTWNSSPSVTGMYGIEVRVRDGYHDGPEGKDDFQGSSFVIRQFVP
jgi:large repetitive protein